MKKMMKTTSQACQATLWSAHALDILEQHSWLLETRATLRFLAGLDD